MKAISATRGRGGSAAGPAAGGAMTGSAVGAGVAVGGGVGVSVTVGKGVGEGTTVAMLPGESPPTRSSMRVESFDSPAWTVIHSSPGRSSATVVRALPLTVVSVLGARASDSVG